MVGAAPLASAAALAAFLAALLFFFLPDSVVTAALGGSPSGCCATGSLESSSVATPSALGVAGRVVLVAGSDSSGSVELWGLRVLRIIMVIWYKID